LLGATISGGSITPLAGDTVTLVTSGRTGVFVSKNVGGTKAVTVSGYAITGADATNYALVQPTGVTADITVRTLAVTGAKAVNKTYDAQLGATISGGAISVLAGDTVTLNTGNRAGLFGDKNVGGTKAVTVSGYTISGADAGNYALVQPAGVTADITARSLVVTGATAANKTYDAQLAATISGGAISPISGDAVTLDISGRAGVFVSKNVGTAKAVTVSGYVLTGADATNYALVQPIGVTADITAGTLAPTDVIPNINDLGVFYPPVVAPPEPVFVKPVVTAWVPPAVSVTLQGPAAATPMLVVSALGMPSSPPELVPVGSIMTITTPAAQPLTEVSVEFTTGFVAGDTFLQFDAPEGLKVNVDNTNGKITISGSGSPAAYSKVLKSLAVRSAGGKRVGGLTLKVGVNTSEGGKSTTTVQLRQGSAAVN